MAEWTMATVLKTVVGASLPGVRIPLPPFKIGFDYQKWLKAHIMRQTLSKGRCQSGRLGPPAKRLMVSKPFMGSNPILPAIINVYQPLIGMRP